MLARVGSASVGGGPQPSYDASAVHFDGSTTLSITSLTTSNSPLLSSSQWVKVLVAPPDGISLWCWDEPNEVPGLFVFSDGTIAFYCGETATYVYCYSAPGAFVFDANWKNIQISMDVNHANGLKIAQCYLNDVEVPLSIDDGQAAQSMTLTGKVVGLPYDPATGFTKMTGDGADWWVAPTQFIDFSVEANRRKFISATGKPVDLGANGGTPTGTAPAIFFSGAASTFGTNLGTGGAFTTTGTLTNASSSPSD